MRSRCPTPPHKRTRGNILKPKLSDWLCKCVVLHLLFCLFWMCVFARGDKRETTHPAEPEGVRGGGGGRKLPTRARNSRKQLVQGTRASNPSKEVAQGTRARNSRKELAQGNRAGNSCKQPEQGTRARNSRKELVQATRARNSRKQLAQATHARISCKQIAQALAQQLKQGVWCVALHVQ